MQLAQVIGAALVVMLVVMIAAELARKEEE